MGREDQIWEGKFQGRNLWERESSEMNANHRNKGNQHKEKDKIHIMNVNVNARKS